MSNAANNPVPASKAPADNTGSGSAKQEDGEDNGEEADGDAFLI